MGCYNEKKSDIDLLVVIEETIPDNIKYRFMDMVAELYTYAPPKGIELSIVKKEVCNPFVYPMPFELHFSIAHLEWYKTNPLDYIDKMKGTDKYLAAHFTIIYHRGKCLYGSDIKEVFGAVPEEDYFDSIWNDIAGAETEIMDNLTYIILNLCRVLAYKKEELILSKQEGGEWGIRNVTEEYQPLSRPEEYMRAALAFGLMSGIVERNCQVSSWEWTKGRNSSNLRMGSWVGSQGLCKTYMVKKRSREMAQLTVRSERERDL